jgi:hypothetical protein
MHYVKWRSAQEMAGWNRFVEMRTAVAPTKINIMKPIVVGSVTGVVWLGDNKGGETAVSPPPNDLYYLC